VKIPDSFISRTANAQAGPASLEQDDYSNDDIQEVERMEDSHGDWSFYLVAFDDSDLAACGKRPFEGVQRLFSARKSCALGLCPVSARKLFNIVGFAKQF
jgi:hypothetical protein